MALNNPLQGGNRTSIPGGTSLDGKQFAFPPITGTGITPVQAAAAAAPILAVLSMIPYKLNDKGTIDHRHSSRALSHAPELRYSNDHPDPALAGKPINSDLLGGAYIAQYGGAPMPHIDMDHIHPETLARFLLILEEAAAAIASAT